MQISSEFVFFFFLFLAKVPDRSNFDYNHDEPLGLRYALVGSDDNLFLDTIIIFILIPSISGFPGLGSLWP